MVVLHSSLPHSLVLSPWTPYFTSLPERCNQLTMTVTGPCTETVRAVPSCTPFPHQSTRLGG